MPTSRVSIIGIALFILWTKVNAAPAVAISPGVKEPALIPVGRAAEFDLDRKDQLSTQEDEGQYNDSDKSAIWQRDANLDKRTKGDINDPIPVTLNVANWQDIAEENCFIMLCRYNGQLKWQRGPQGIASRHRTESGAGLNPFYPANLGSRHTSQISQATTSPEEFPWASMNQGGVGAHLMPATKAQQDYQGGAINAAYNTANPPVAPMNWFTIRFNNYDASRIYCPALFRTPPDFSVCGKKKTTEYGVSIDPEDYDYIKDLGVKPYIFHHPS
ncbi:hypothetical protein F4680DRAFT_466253 [Xylaria scruposa]|nr:hypothetical protein F4680DRAFT_466253 [Xylaria scruposa]